MNALASSPLGSGSISLRLYPHDLPPADIVTELRAQASMAEEAGFDGVMTSEHHGGVPNYLPNPLLAASWALEVTERLWAAPCPTLLPLRAATHVVEDLAWTAQRFPGRVGVGFASGAFERDFELAGVPFGEMVPRFASSLAIVARALAGAPDEPLAADPADRGALVVADPGGERRGESWRRHTGGVIRSRCPVRFDRVRPAGCPARGRAPLGRRQRCAHPHSPRVGRRAARRQRRRSDEPLPGRRVGAGGRPLGTRRRTRRRYRPGRGGRSAARPDDRCRLRRAQHPCVPRRMHPARGS